MILALHNLASTYNMLPSQALNSASTFDLYVLDCHYKYIKYQEDKMQGKEAPKQPKNLSQDQMMAMIQAVRNKEQGAKDGVKT